MVFAKVDQTRALWGGFMSFHHVEKVKGQQLVDNLIDRKRLEQTHRMHGALQKKESKPVFMILEVDFCT